MPVSFSLTHRGRLVVTGPNGAGKSTLLSVAAGELAPDTGSVQRPRSTRLGFLRQETALPPDRRASEVFGTYVDELTEALGPTQAAVVVSSHDRQLLRHVEHWPQLPITPAAAARGEAVGGGY